MKKMLLFTSLIILSCNHSAKNPAAFGSIRGNVYWKYNNYIGNRPDAGAEIDAYNTDDTSAKFNTTADIRGDYSFDSIPAGSYFLSTRSKATNERSFSSIQNAYYYRTFLERFWRIDTLSIINSYKAAKPLDSLAIQVEISSVDFHGKKAIDAFNLEKDLRHAADSISEVAVKAIKIKNPNLVLFGFFKYDFQFKEVKPNRITTVITDFGTTYY